MKAMAPFSADDLRGMENDRNLLKDPNLLGCLAFVAQPIFPSRFCQGFPQPVGRTNPSEAGKWQQHRIFTGKKISGRLQPRNALI
jgi:hypothetical protein